MSSRVVLIGEAPGPRSDPSRPLFPSPKNSAGYRLYKLTGLPVSLAYLKSFDRMNLFSEHPGTWSEQKRPKDRWPVRDARIAAQSARFLLRDRKAIFVGRRVAQAFGYDRRQLPFFHWAECQTWRFRFACIPHTSGRSHWYNDAENMAMARAFFEDLLREGLSSAPDRARET